MIERKIAVTVSYWIQYLICDPLESVVIALSFCMMGNRFCTVVVMLATEAL